MNHLILLPQCSDAQCWEDEGGRDSEHDVVSFGVSAPHLVGLVVAEETKCLPPIVLVVMLLAKKEWVAFAQQEKGAKCLLLLVLAVMLLVEEEEEWVV